MCEHARIRAFACMCRPDMIRSVSLDLFLIRKYMRVVEWVKGRIMQAVSGIARCAWLFLVSSDAELSMYQELY